jgi:hypothetical protein
MNPEKPLDYIDPAITEGINKVTYKWDDWGLLVSAERLSRDGEAELRFYHENGTGRKTIDIVHMNLLRPNSMKSYAKSLSDKSESVPWEQVLTKIKVCTLEYQRRGEPGIVIQPTTEDIKHPGYYLEPLIVKGMPNVIFGDSGGAKTTVSLLALGTVFCSPFAGPSGFKSDIPARVGMLDWESDYDTTMYNASRLVEGGSVPYFELPYLPCRHSLVDDIDRIMSWKEENKIDLLLIDSLGQAAGTSKYDSSGREAALNFFMALRQINVTSLIIAQNAKGEDSKKSIFGSVYYQYYSRNIFELKDTESGTNKDEKIIALVNTKSNYSGKSEPIGLKVSYSPNTIVIESQHVTLSQLKDKISDSETILDFMREEARLVTAKEIAEAIGKNEHQTRVVLSNLKTRNLIVNPQRGLYGLAYKG